MRLSILLLSTLCSGSLGYVVDGPHGAAVGLLFYSGLVIFGTVLLCVLFWYFGFRKID